MFLFHLSLLTATAYSKRRLDRPFEIMHPRSQHPCNGLRLRYIWPPTCIMFSMRGTAGSPLQDDPMQRTNNVSGPPSDAANTAKIFHARTWSTRCCDSAIPTGGVSKTNLDFTSNGIQSGSVDAVSLTRTVVLCVVTFF